MLVRACRGNLAAMSVGEGDVVVGLRGRYRIETRHGEGSFGVTYRATDAASGAEVIVKELRVEKLDDWKALELFEREGEVLATLSHPNIPAFRDFFAHGAAEPLPVSAMSSYAGPVHLSLVLVQQFITGSTLQQRVDLGQRLSASEGIAVLRALLGACTTCTSARRLSYTATSNPATSSSRRRASPFSSTSAPSRTG
jgi:serine/threonine protein kinase